MFFYDFLGPRLRARKLSSQRIRERAFHEDRAPEGPSRLVVCADDFGLTREISQSIIGLAKRGKVNAISCMSVCSGWERDAELLRSLPDSVQIGLHVTLTEEVPLTAMPVLAWDGAMPGCNELGRRALVRRLPLGELRTEIAAQFDRFVDVIGRPPDFVDGHQHVHVLRGIREIILAETARRAPRAWIRNCVDRPAAMFARHFPLKALANAVQSRGVRRAAADLGLACNDGFAGLYDFAGDYEALFPKFLDKPGNFHLIICHPGEGERPDDAIARARQREAAALRHMPIHEMAAARGLHFEAARH
ncbi:ChbG/HpnK family deacetylase [Sphingobium sp. H33]|uniref:ChbG/HpnK family deacetylase n=2 Tax=Sphingobium nicotianae TaxID=2782607 RepID=A0A9X1IR58_9SPHN|nr:ChbG/HpnK family deacetylase [Sphingobium nicotianae]